MKKLHQKIRIIAGVFFVCAIANLFHDPDNSKNFHIFEVARTSSLPTMFFLFSIATFILALLTKLSDEGRFFYRTPAENPNFYLIALAVKISQIDGVLESREVQEIDKLIRKFSAVEDKLEAYKVIKIARSADFGVENLAELYREAVRGREIERRLAFEFLVSVVSSFGKIDNSERNALQSIAAIFKMPAGLLDELLTIQGNYRYFNETENSRDKRGFKDSFIAPDSKEWAFYELGCENGADIQTIKRNYRTLVKQYHPDKLQQRGISGTLLKQGKEKFFRVQKAYEILVG